MTERDYAPLSTACVRGLCDKLYEKRKFAGVEIEKMVKDFNDANNSNQIKRLIRVLGQDLMSSTNINVKNGALMGLSSVAVGLGQGCVAYLSELTHPIIACLGESEARVRYSATEALFNVLKIARGDSLTLFPIVFDALARLAADPESQVRHGAELLDRLVKDIVVESGRVQLSALVPLVRARMYSRGAGARQFAVGWVSALDAAPALGLRAHLPQLLDPLFAVLDDPNPEIRRMCEVQLNEFLRSIKKEPEQVDFPAMINILITHAQATDELLQLTAITWLKEFCALSGRALRPHVSGVLAAALPALAYHDQPRRKIREMAAIVNLQLMKLVVSERGSTDSDELGEPELEDRTEPQNAADIGKAADTGRAADTRRTADTGKTEDTGKEADTEKTVETGTTTETGKSIDEKTAEGAKAEPDLDIDAVVEVLTNLLHHNSVHTKVATLDWILHLYTKLPAVMYSRTERVFPGAVSSLTDPADDVVRRGLAVLAEICSCPTPGPAPAGHAPAGALDASPYYHKFLQALVALLATDENLLEDRGAFIIRQLCVLLGAEEVFAALARILHGATDLRFAARLVDVLSTLLLTAAELHHTRRQLRAFSDPATHALFGTLYASWCHSPVALLSLCLLTHNYDHCNRLIATFGDLEITVDFLTEVDKLVQLIESPIFAYLRLELLSGPASAELRGALFGLLMLLPQSDAFHALRRRLQCAPAVPLQLPPRDAGPPPELDFSSLLEQFVSLQERHRRARLRERRACRPH